VISGNGRVTSSPAGIDCPGVCTHTFAANSYPFLNASPASGWYLDAWSANTGCFLGADTCPLVPSDFKNGLLATAYFSTF
jgi:hypothetical protein